MVGMALTEAPWMACIRTNEPGWGFCRTSAVTVVELRSFQSRVSMSHTAAVGAEKRRTGLY